MRDKFLVVTLAIVMTTAPVATSAASASDRTDGTAELIIHFEGGEVTEQDLDLLRSYGFDGGHLYDNVPAVWTAGPDHVIEELRRHPLVQHVEHNRKVTVDLDSSRKAVGAESSELTPGVSESFGLSGEGTTVAVVDTGIDATHPDLPWGSKVKLNYKVSPPIIERVTGFYSNTFEFLSQRNTDDNGHGTHVAGTICGTGAASEGRYTGVAPGCDLVGLGALTGGVATTAQTAGALDWVLSHHEEFGISVVSNSWGSGGSYNENGVTETLIRKLAHDGVLPVFAAGNDGPDEGTMSPYSTAPEAIGVANYDDRSGRLSSTSSRGVEGDPFRSPDVAAPGTSIVAPAATALGGEALGGYASLSGTSMAAPHVSGVAALLEQADPSLTPFEIKELLEDTARSDFVEVDGEDGLREAKAFEAGSGAIDAHRAVGEVLEGEQLHAELPGSGPLSTATVTQDSVNATGSLNLDPGPQEPADWPVTGTMLLFHDLVAAGINPSSSTALDFTVAAGENVSIEARDVVSGHPDIEVTTETPARFRVTDVHGDTVDLLEAPGPHASGGTSSTGAPEIEVTSHWHVPEDLETGRYKLTLEVDPPGPVGWVAGPGANVDVDNAGTPAPWPPMLPDGPSPPDVGGASAAQVDNPAWSGDFTFDATDDVVVFEDDFETREDGYTTTVDGFLQGQLTQWSYVGDAAPLWISPHSGENAWFVGLPGAGAASGTGYTDNADSSLILPTLDLSGFTDANLTYHVSGFSEAGFDFLRVEARPAGGAWTELSAHDGAVTGWDNQTRDLSEFLGDQVQIRFRFASDGFVNTGVGWLVDDVRVTAQSGTAPTAELSADPTFGQQTVDFELDGQDPDGTVDSWTLDLGDGTSETGTSLPAEVTHTYDQGVFTATLTVEDDQGATGSDQTTVNTVTGVQVNAGDGWVDAVDDSQDGDWSSWHAELDLSNLEDGDQTLEARYPDGRGGFLTDEVPYLLASEPVIQHEEDLRSRVNAPTELSVEVLSPSGDATIDWDLDDDGNFDDASGSTIQTTFTDAGHQTVGVRAEDAADASKTSTATFEVQVFEVVPILDETEDVVAAVPDELATFGFLGQPGLSPQADAYPVNVTQLEADLGGEVVELGANLTWEVHHTHGLVSVNDFDLWAEDPNGTFDAQGATAGAAEQFNATDPKNGNWTLWATPFLVVEPDTYHLTAEVHVVPTAS